MITWMPIPGSAATMGIRAFCECCPSIPPRSYCVVIHNGNGKRMIGGRGWKISRVENVIGTQQRTKCLWAVEDGLRVLVINPNVEAWLGWSRPRSTRQRRGISLRVGKANRETTYCGSQSITFGPCSQSVAISTSTAGRNLHRWNGVPNSFISLHTDSPGRQSH